MLVKTFRILFFLIILTIPLQIVHADCILWDISHGPLDDFHPDGNYSEFFHRFGMIGYEMRSGEQPIDFDVLWDVDILVCSVLSNYDDAYTEDEAERIAAFVNGGGGLLILADNSDLHPDNLANLLDRFGLIAAQGEDIDELEIFADLPLFERIESIDFDEGETVGVVEDEDGELVAFDVDDNPGVAVNNSFNGKVVLIGDADIWTNLMIDQADNCRFAINTIFFLDREHTGGIEYIEAESEVYLPQGSTWSISTELSNSGEGYLEVGCRFMDNPDWISCQPVYGAIEPGGSLDLDIIFSTDDLEVDDTVSAILTVNHNDPERAPLEIEYTLHVISPEPVHFEPPDPIAIDHSILIREVLIEGQTAPPGFEIGVFTPEGLCGGASVSRGGQVGVAAIADNPNTEEIDGFQNGEPFAFRLYLPWSDTELDAIIEYESGPNHFRVAGFTALRLNARHSAVQHLRLNQRWNMISLNLHPPDLAMEEIFAPLLESDLLIRIKDGNGRFWDIPRGFCNLREWNITGGYQVKMAQPSALEISGVEVDPQTPIDLRPGWNMIAYLPQEAMPLEDALMSILDHLEIVKRDDGAFYLAQWDWNGIGYLEPSEGYWIRISNTDRLIYPDEDQEAQFYNRFEPAFEPSPSGLDMSLLLEGLPAYTQVRIISSDGRVVGCGSVDNTQRIGLPVWGDDPESYDVEGLREGQAFFVQCCNGRERVSTEVTWLQGDNRYRQDEFSVGRVITDIPLTGVISLEAVPNPFNDRLLVYYSFDDAGDAIISVYDLTGRLIEQCTIVQPTANMTGRIDLNASDYPAGVLLLKLSTVGSEMVTKIVHLP